MACLNQASKTFRCSLSRSPPGSPARRFAPGPVLPRSIILRNRRSMALPKSRSTTPLPRIFGPLGLHGGHGLQHAPARPALTERISSPLYYQQRSPASLSKLRNNRRRTRWNSHSVESIALNYLNAPACSSLTSPPPQLDLLPLTFPRTMPFFASSWRFLRRHPPS